MKKSVLFLTVIIFAILFAGCNNKKNENTEWLSTPDSALVEADDIYPATFFLEGTFFLDGELGGETSPRVHYAFHQNSDYYVSLVLLSSSSVENPSSGPGIPLDLALKIRDIVKESASQPENFSFLTDDNGWVWIGYYSGSSNDNQPLNSAIELLDKIQKETKWFILKDNWEAK